jgi:hypothetical protein
MKKDRFLSASEDRFFICVEARDPKFDPEGTRRLFESVGAGHIDLVEDED